MSSNNNQGEPAILLLMVIALSAGLCWLVWHATRLFWLDYFFRWLRYGEIWIVNLVSHIFSGHDYSACLTWLRTAKTVDPNPSEQVIEATNACFGPHYLAAQSAADRAAYFVVSGPSIAMLGAVAALYYRWPMALALALIAVHTLFISPRNKYMTKHTLESFIDTQAKMWPVISPIVKFNPSKSGRILGSEVPDKLPMFAEPLSPEEWVSWNRIPMVNNIPDRDIARRAFIQQLGPRWTGLDGAPPHIRALFAAFAIKGAQKREESDELLGKLALAWSPEKGFRMDAELTAYVAKLINDPEIGKPASQIADKFAWRTTALLGLLRWARAQGGVLAPAQFVWLRAEDRALWYPLNNLGRRSFHTEGAGAMAHFMAEEAAQKPLPIPRIDNAYATLNVYFNPRDDTARGPGPIPPREGAKT